MQVIKDPISGLYRAIGRVTRASLGFEHHGCLTFMLTVDYGGAMQGVGGFQLSSLDDGPGDRRGIARPTAGDWIIRLVRAFGVRSWEDIKGRTAYFLWASEVQQHTMPIGIENLPTEKGEQFLFADMNSI